MIIFSILISIILVNICSLMFIQIKSNFIFFKNLFLKAFSKNFTYFIFFLFFLIYQYYWCYLSKVFYIFNAENVLIFCTYFNITHNIINFDFWILEFELIWLDFFFNRNESIPLNPLNKTILNWFLIDFFNSNLIKINFFKSITFSNNPYFFYFFLFFFSTVLSSWLFFTYLSFYGIFFLNLFSLLIFWISLLFYTKSIFLENKIFEIKIFSWIFLNDINKLDYYFFIDSLSFSFILLTTTIALFVYVYAFSYFRYEPLVDRFLLFLLSFVVSMIFLVSSGNLIMLFLGWELIGLTSFFLINFWTTKTATLKSAFKAFSFNKLSDFYLFLFIICIYSIYDTLDINTFLLQIYKGKHIYIYMFDFQINSLELISIFVLFASFIKSAQIGGHFWLPDSMEAPVPASALIHSATLVSAGIYLILRFNPLFTITQFSSFILPFIGSLTAAYGGICAAFQTDLKKILAYSTISHCGFMVLLCSIEMNEFAILYLYTHGFFKAITFMCVGNILRISQNYQDFRKMGNLLKYLPFEYYCILICILNLSGLPFTFGFFVKHLIFLNLYNNIYMYYFVLINTSIGAISGLFYSYYLLKYIFFGPKKGNKSVYIHLNRKEYNSIYYSNTSFGSIIALLFLFFSSYIIIYFLFLSFLKNFIFSEYVNFTVLSSYFLICNELSNFNLNFFFFNFFVIYVLLFFFITTVSKNFYKSNFYKNIFFKKILFMFFITFLLLFSKKIDLIEIIIYVYLCLKIKLLLILFFWIYVLYKFKKLIKNKVTIFFTVVWFFLKNFNKHSMNILVDFIIFLNKVFYITFIPSFYAFYIGVVPLFSLYGYHSVIYSLILSFSYCYIFGI